MLVICEFVELSCPDVSQQEHWADKQDGLRSLSSSLQIRVGWVLYRVCVPFKREKKPYYFL